MVDSLRRLGRSQIRVSPIGLGCWQFSKGRGLGGRFWPSLEDKDIKSIVMASLLGGVNWFDTAEAYGRGRSEAALAKALSELGKADGDVVVATKWLPMLRTHRSIPRTIDTRLKHLEPFSIDLHQIHGPWLCWSGDPKLMDAMAELVEARKIRSIGVSNYSTRRMTACHEALAKRDLELVSNQIQYSLLDRRAETAGIIEAAKSKGITIIAYSPLSQGLLSGKFHENPGLIKQRRGPRRFMQAFKRKGLEKSAPVINELRAIAEHYDATPAQIALRWVIQFHGDTVVAIPGATKPSHAEDNVGAMGFELTAQELERLDEVSQPFL